MRRAVAVEVELDVSEGRRGVADWRPVQLLFVRGVNEPGEPEVGKKNWALFLCTDAKLGCIPHRLYPSLCDSLPDAGSREVGMWRCPNR